MRKLVDLDSYRYDYQVQEVINKLLGTEYNAELPNFIVIETFEE